MREFHEKIAQTSTTIRENEISAFLASLRAFEDGAFHLHGNLCVIYKEKAGRGTTHCHS